MNPSALRKAPGHPLHALAQRWRQTATELRDYGETTRAGVLERCAGELDGLMDEYERPSEETT